MSVLLTLLLLGQLTGSEATRPEGPLIERRGPHEPLEPGIRTYRMYTNVEPTQFSMLVNGTTGQPTAREFCNYATGAGLVTGSESWCWSGDGSDWSGGLQFQSSGSPLMRLEPLCPNSPDCAAINTMHWNTSTYDGAYETTTTHQPTGVDFTACVLGRWENTGATSTLITHNNGSSGWYMNELFNGKINFVVGNGTTTSSLQSTTAMTYGAWHIVCVVYDYVGDGTSVVTHYLDGAANGTSSTHKGLAGVSAYTYTVGAIPAQGVGSIGGAFYTETKLNSTQLTALTNAVLGRPFTGGSGETVTFARTSTTVCLNSTGTGGNFLPSGYPCINGNGLKIEDSGSNILLRSQEFDAGWTATNLGTLVADQTYAPDGTRTADKLDEGAASATHQLGQVITITTGQTHTFSVYAKTGTNSTMGLKYGSSTASAKFNLDTCEVTVNPVSPSTAYTQGVAGGWCRVILVIDSTIAVTSPVTMAIYPTDGTSQTYQGTNRYFYLWGAQMEQKAYATSYIRTEGTSATRQAETATVPVSMTQYDPFCVQASTYHGPGNWGGLNMSFLSAGSGDNSWQWWISTTYGMRFRLYDASSAEKRVDEQLTTALTAGSHSWRSCANAGTFTHFRDSSAAPGAAATGAGTGILGGNATDLNIGNGISPLNGYIKNIKICKNGTGC